MPTAPALPGYQWKDSLPGLTFDAPVTIAAPPGETNRLFIVERTGRILVVTNLTQPTSSVFLDLSENLHSSYLEAGLLGLAFHPGFATNRQFFTYRTAIVTGLDGRSFLANVLARFETRADAPHEADPTSELRLIVQEDANDAHNGGDLQFGPEGYLYLTLGDESAPAHQTDGSRQPLDAFFGAVLRLDVDQRPGNLPPNPHPGTVQHYLIPHDNPLVGVTEFNGRPIPPATARTEFFAWGFRNPWRMAIDERTGAIYVGDVGGAKFEEINLLRPGGNYGWPYREGQTNGIHWFLALPTESYDEPWITYPHGSSLQSGNSVLGGVVHRGNLLPELRDRLVFGDVRSGHTWAVRLDASGQPHMEWLCTLPGLVTYARDPCNGEILAAHYPTGRILSLHRIETGTNSPTETRVPETLSATGVFSDLTTLEPSPAYTSYSINAPFWSDHALKQRWVAVPEGTSATRRDDGTLDFPAGTIWVKHFEIELTRGEASTRRRLETRLIVRTADGAYGVTYRWNPEGTEAFLVPPEGVDEPLRIQTDTGEIEQVWHYPGHAECMRCHTDATGYAAGFSLEQLNRSVSAAGSERGQLNWLIERGILPASTPEASKVAAMVNPFDDTKPLHTRARSYLASNCSSCHWPGSLPDTTARWDARLRSSLEETGLLDGRLCLPGQPTESRLFQVVNRSAVDLVMPPLASNVTDQRAAELLASWIRTLPSAPWTATDLGRSALPGGATVDPEGGTLVLSASGAGFHEPSLPPGIVSRPWSGDGFFEAMLDRLDSTGPDPRAGLFVAGSADRIRSPEISLSIDAAGRTHRFTSDRAGAPRTVTGATLQMPVRIRAQRTGTTLTTSLISPTQSMGVQVLSTLPSDGTWHAGWMAASGDAIQQSHAWFSQWTWADAHWISPEPGGTFPFGAPISLAMELATEGISVSRVDFQVDGTTVATVAAAPHQAIWTGAPAGTHALTALVTLSDGRSFSTRSRSVVVLPPPTLVTQLAEDATTAGNWIARYGTEGYLLSDEIMVMPADTAVFVRGGAYHTLAEESSDPAALLGLDGQRRFAGCWLGNPELTVHVDRTTADSYRLGLYVVDWEGFDLAEQTFELIDPLSGTVLDRLDIARFSGGFYQVWKVSGSVKVRITGRNGAIPSLSAVFVDAPRPGAGQATIALPVADARFRAPTEVALAAQPVRDDRPPTWVEFLVDGEVVAADDTLPFTASWSPALVGSHILTVRAYDEVSQPQDSPPVAFTVDPALPQVSYLGTVASVRGDWIRRLGSEAWRIPPHHGATAHGIQISLASGRDYRWIEPIVGTPIADSRAPLLPDGSREAACWTSTSELLVQFDLPDGLPHVVTLYFVDWDTNLRKQTVEWSAPGVEAPFDSRTLTRFFDGTHAAYLVQGRVFLKIISENINAVLSGIFVDPYVPDAPSFHGIGSLTTTEQGVRMDWRSPAGCLFRVHYSQGLLDAWVPFADVLSSADGFFSEIDPLPPSDEPVGRFYRLERISDGSGPFRPAPPVP